MILQCIVIAIIATLQLFVWDWRSQEVTLYALILLIIAKGTEWYIETKRRLDKLESNSDEEAGLLIKRGTIISRRNPTDKDVNYKIGQVWINEIDVNSIWVRCPMQKEKNETKTE